MSWAITVNDLDQIDDLPDEIYYNASKDNPVYEADARLAFRAAKDAGLVSATLSGGRTPSMYGGPDTVTISVVGFDSRAEAHAVPPISGRNFNAAVLGNIYAGPDLEDGLDEFDAEDPDGEWHAPYGG
jgi:hypothetical protein